jgi:hypothetical protein
MGRFSAKRSAVGAVRLNASRAGCFAGATGACGVSETLFPQRVRASFVPSLTSVSPLCNNNLRFVQKTSFPMR